MKKFYFIIAKEKLYSYLVSIFTIVILFFMSSQIKNNNNNSEMVSTNLINTQNEIVPNDKENDVYN